MIRHADFRLLPDVAHRVRVSRVVLVRHLDATDQLPVEVVVRKDHALVHGRVRAGAVDVAVEEVVRRRAEGCLDVVLELGDDVGDLGEVGVVV